MPLGAPAQMPASADTYQRQGYGGRAVALLRFRLWTAAAEITKPAPNSFGIIKLSHGTVFSVGCKIKFFAPEIPFPMGINFRGDSQFHRYVPDNFDSLRSSLPSFHNKGSGRPR